MKIKIYYCQGYFTPAILGTNHITVETEAALIARMTNFPRPEVKETEIELEVDVPLRRQNEPVL